MVLPTFKWRLDDWSVSKDARSTRKRLRRLELPTGEKSLERNRGQATAGATGLEPATSLRAVTRSNQLD
jgi:hypothetical protein